MTPRVSVIVPLYHCDRYISQAGSSVLAQTKTVTIYKLENILPNLPAHEEGNLGTKLANLNLYPREF